MFEKNEANSEKLERQTELGGGGRVLESRRASNTSFILTVTPVYNSFSLKYAVTMFGWRLAAAPSFKG